MEPGPMTTQQSLEQILQNLPEDRLREVLDFARFLRWRDERAAWKQFGRMQFARAYGPAEPDYSEADIKPDAGSCPRAMSCSRGFHRAPAGRPSSGPRGFGALRRCGSAFCYAADTKEIAGVIGRIDDRRLERLRSRLAARLQS